VQSLQSCERKRWTFFWNDYDCESENLDAGLILCSRCWRRYSGKKLGQEKWIDREERLTDLKVAEKELSESGALRGYVSDVRTNGLSIVFLEDLAEDKSKRKSAKRWPAAMPATFSLRQLAQLPPSGHMAYVQAFPNEIEKLKPGEQDTRILIGPSQ
jgi:hypothetical protein